jgi:hypothetical protein
MTIHTASKHIHKLLLGVGLLTVLVSCGGGDSSPPPPDTTPNAFTITAITGAAVNTEVSSAPVSVTGVDQAVPISITGGTYSITGGAFTNAAGTISNNQSVVVKVTSSTSTSTAVEAVLTIGGVAGSFKVTTLVDVTPNDFSFTPATGVVPKSVSTSAAITIASIDIAVPISITGGEYSIDDGAYTSTAGTVSKTQTLKVRGTASASLSTSTNVELTVGGVKGTYAITTFADTVAPTAQILFPPPASMTEGNTILVRGSATDDYSTVTSVKVSAVNKTTGVEVTKVDAASTDGFKNWQVSVPLTALTDTNLVVTTEDSVGNKSTNAAQAMIRQAAFSSAFPDADNSFNYIQSLAIDQLEGRSRVLVSDNMAGFISIDLASGKRTIFGGFQDDYKFGLTIDPLTQRLYVLSTRDSKTFLSVDLRDASKYEEFYIKDMDKLNPWAMALNQTTSPTTIVVASAYPSGDVYSTTSSFLSAVPFSTATLPNSDNAITESYGIAFDKKNNRYLAIDVNNYRILAIDASTGARSIFSSNTVGTGEVFGEVYNDIQAALYGIQIDEDKQRAIAVEAGSGKLFAIDLATGNRSLISNRAESAIENVGRDIYGLAISNTNGYALTIVRRRSLNAVIAIDLLTGKRVVVSKNSGTDKPS